MIPLLKAKIDLLKDVPGTYLMKDKDGTIIYVGKAKSLIKRVKQYFYRPQVGKVFAMVREIVDFDTIETTSEKEALLLELNLIQKYYPKYNILLKDGKSYPYIALKKKWQQKLPFLYLFINFSIASIDSSLITCSILQASSLAVSFETPIDSRKRERILCLA